MAKAEMLLEIKTKVASEWVSTKDRMPPTSEPVVYCRPDRPRQGRWVVGIAYWTISDKWNPEMESTANPGGFTHWLPLPPAPE